MKLLAASVLVLALGLGVASRARATEPQGAPASAQSLWDAWPAARVSPPDPYALKHAGLRTALAALQAGQPGLFTIVEEGVSCEGRKIPLLRVGTGAAGILLWSQMHGDEPTATSALLDLLNWLGANRDRAEVRQLLAKVTLWNIPMLNPDGAERNQRWNAQELDMNRDALRLSTPEGRFLKRVRDRELPVLGFNLHNESPNLTAGFRGQQVAISLLSVPGDEALSDTPGTRLTKRLAVGVARRVSALAPGRVARYDMDYTERAFGDSMTRWGTPTLLIEAGGWSGPGEAERLVRLNFVGLLGSLFDFADGSVEALDVADYARIPVNHRDALPTFIVHNVRLASGRGLPPFTADLSFTLPAAFAGGGLRRREPAILEVGDLSYARGLTELDAAGLLAVPWPVPEARTDWPALRKALEARGLGTGVAESRLLEAVRALGEGAVARPGFNGAVLLYRPGGAGTLTLAGAILHGRPVGL